MHFINSLKLETQQLKGINTVIFIYLVGSVDGGDIETRFYMLPMLAWNFLHSQDWPQTLYHFALASLMLGIEDRATTPSKTVVYSYSGLLLLQLKTKLLLCIAMSVNSKTTILNQRCQIFLKNHSSDST